MSPDAHLLLIDPNEVQLSPWRDRAIAYAADDPVEALDALELVRAEIRRRLGVLRTLPGVVRKVDRSVAVEHGFPLWVLVIDELAFHTSVVGTAGQTTTSSDVILGDSWARQGFSASYIGITARGVGWLLSVKAFSPDG